jgi:hypothetical protein
MYFNWKLGNGIIAIAFIFLSTYIVYDAFRDYSQKCEIDRIQQNLSQVVEESAPMVSRIERLKEDKKEIYKALASCNFLRETENLPIGDINKDLVKSVSFYGGAEALVTKALEKYKED